MSDKVLIEELRAHAAARTGYTTGLLARAADALEAQQQATNAQSAPDEREAVLSAGNGLSNIAYNLAQLEGVPLSHYTCELLRMQREQWDKAVASWQRAQSAPAGAVPDEPKAQPEVAENTGSHAMATNQLQRQEQAVGLRVEGVAAPVETLKADVIGVTRELLERACVNRAYLPGSQIADRAINELRTLLAAAPQPGQFVEATDMVTARQEQGDDGVLFGFDDRSVRVSQEAYSIFLEREQAAENEVQRLREAVARADEVLAALTACTTPLDRLERKFGKDWCQSVDMVRSELIAALAASAEGKA